MHLLRSACLATTLAATAVLTAACGDEEPPSYDRPAPEKTEQDVTDSFGPGGTQTPQNPGDGACAATVAQTAKSKVDIIFVIDSSGSMNAEMVQIKSNVNAFAAKIGGSGLDYTVTFVTPRAKTPTATGNVICVPAPLAGANCADKAPTFFHVDQSVGSSNSLDLILSTYPKWSGHLRADATKVFVEVTDDEASMASAAFDTKLLALGGFGTAAKRNYVFHSIISKPAATPAPSTSQCSTAAGSSVKYQELSKLTGGLMDEVCKTDYSATLDNMAKGIVDKVGCELGYPTSEAADPTQVVVQVTPAGATAKPLTQVTDASKCGTIADAWYYDDPAKPTKIILCPTTCSSATASSGAKIEALVGCKAPTPK